MILPRVQAGHLTPPDGGSVPYAIIGSGSVPVVVVAGTGDALATAEQTARRLAWFYRKRVSTQRILVLSRRHPFPIGYSQSQQANDMLWAINALDWGPSVIECNSASGPVGEWMCVKEPETVRGLILSSTFARTDDNLRAVLTYWMMLARNRNWEDLRWSQFEYTYRPQSVGRYRALRPLLRFVPKPRSPERAERLFASLLETDNRRILPRIACPTLVIGGENDRVISAHLQREMERLIPNARLVLYPGYGHGNQQENPDYAVQVDQFIASL